jgi:hypothetical protein
MRFKDTGIPPLENSNTEAIREPLDDEFEAARCDAAASSGYNVNVNPKGANEDD